jgi:hypothetical protein
MDQVFAYTNSMLSGSSILFSFVLGIRIAGTLLLYVTRAAFGIVSTADSSD